MLVMPFSKYRAAENISDGNCGENVSWILDSEGLLTVSGNGEMADYPEVTDVPWYDQRESISAVLIEDGVTGIGDNAFAGCVNLTDVSIAASVTRIGEGVFADCPDLELDGTGGAAVQSSAGNLMLAVNAVSSLSITEQPVDFYGAAGATIRFQVKATGDGLTYQWYFKRSTDSGFSKSTLSSGTKATYTMTMADKYDGWQYYCIVTDSTGNTAQSNTVTVHKSSSVQITTQPTDIYGAIGDVARISVAAAGDGLTYQWYYKTPSASSFSKSTSASGTTDTYSITLNAKHDGYQYYCVVADSYGNRAVSDTVTIHLVAGLQITAQPTDITANIGDVARFKVTAAGEGLTYQWYYKSPYLHNFAKATSASATTATYSVTLNAKHDGYQYYCIVSDAYGHSVQSDTVTVHLQWTIINQPTDFYGKAGDTITFSVNANGEDLSYQWYYKKTGATGFIKSGLASGTNATYTMKMADKYDGWQYYCIVTDSDGNSVRSNTVSVILAQPKAAVDGAVSMKVLILGNSYAQDSAAYAPFILEGITDKIDLTLGISYYSGATLSDYSDFFDNDTALLEYDKHYYGAARWIIAENRTVKQILADEDWDVIVFHQASPKYADIDSFSVLNDLIDKVVVYKASVHNKPLRLGWLAAQLRLSTGVTFEQQQACVQEILAKTPIDFVIPCGTAVANARQIPALDGLGDKGHMTADTNGHLQEGLPCLPSNYVTVLKLLELAGLNCYGVLGEQTRPDAAWLAAHVIPGQNGSPVGLGLSDTEANVLLAQKCAVSAVKDPFAVTDVLSGVGQ